MADTFETRSGTAIIPNPPRFTGNQDADYRAMIEWMNGFYQGSVVESGLLDPEYQASGADDIDYDDLPDPSNTTIARAQAVANAAYEAAAAVATGSFTITGTDTSASIAFSQELADASYKVIATATGFTGTPAASAFVVAAVTKAATGMAFTLYTAPGASNSVTFDFAIYG